MIINIFFIRWGGGGREAAFSKKLTGKKNLGVVFLGCNVEGGQAHFAACVILQ
jgi:hypothetical protein